MSSQFIACWLPILLLWFIIYQQRKRIRVSLKARIDRKHGGKKEMEELIQKYMNQGVAIHTIDDTVYGIVKSLEKGWVTIEYKGKEKHINSEYMVTIEPYKIKEKK